LLADVVRALRDHVQYSTCPELEIEEGGWRCEGEMTVMKRWGWRKRRRQLEFVEKLVRGVLWPGTVERKKVWNGSA